VIRRAYGILWTNAEVTWGDFMNPGAWIVTAFEDNAILSTGEAGAAMGVIRDESASKRRTRITACIIGGI
jgi:hypothetical protein